jgi:hypothetical protein
VGDRLQDRINEIEQRRDEYQALLDKYGDENDFPTSKLQKLYRRFETDQGVKDRRSKYTRETKKRGIVGTLKEKSVIASKLYGGQIPIEILQEIRARGIGAWASGGHRPAQTPESWGIARVNSFLVGGKTFFTTDSDLADLLPKKVQQNIMKNAMYKQNVKSNPKKYATTVVPIGLAEHEIRKRDFTNILYIGKSYDTENNERFPVQHYRATKNDRQYDLYVARIYNTEKIVVKQW